MKLADQEKGRNYDWNLYLSNQQIAAIELRRQKQLAKDVGPKTLKEFKQALTKRYATRKSSEKRVACTRSIGPIWTIVNYSEALLHRVSENPCEKSRSGY